MLRTEYVQLLAVCPTFITSGDIILQMQNQMINLMVYILFNINIRCIWSNFFMQRLAERILSCELCFLFSFSYLHQIRRQHTSNYCLEKEVKELTNS